MQKNTEVQTFFITSYGRTATYWLASIFNAHPDIFCTHGPTTERYSVEYENERLGSHTSEHVHRNQDFFYSLSLDSIISSMQAKASASVYGNVHAFTAANFNQKLTESKLSHPYRWVNLLRHPFTRIESFAQEWHREVQHNGFLRTQLESIINNHSSCQSLMELARSRYPVDFSDFKDRLFVYALIQQGNDLSDAALPCKHVRYEHLVTDIEYFIWFFHYVTGQKIVPHEDMVQAFRHSKSKNSSQSQGSLSLELIHRWEKWKTLLVRFCLETTPEMVKMYRNLNYEVDCIFDVSL